MQVLAWPLASSTASCLSFGKDGEAGQVGGCASPWVGVVGAVYGNSSIYLIFSLK